MNRKSKAIAITALAFGTIGATAAEASAQVKPEPTYNQAPVVEKIDDTTAEGIQAGASALAGASLAFGGLWVYRRRQHLAV
jgi:hypothetical protein